MAIKQLIYLILKEKVKEIEKTFLIKIKNIQLYKICLVIKMRLEIDCQVNNFILKYNNIKIIVSNLTLLSTTNKNFQKKH